MCGIYGRFNPEGQLCGQDIDRRLAQMNHRGPDGAHHFISDCGTVALGHRRLAIVELTDLGKQPMQSQNGQFWITFNGEIYNFQELRSELELLGRKFRGGSDTEVLLDAFEVWGQDALQRFDGMFALAILETNEQGKPMSLFLARDRAGEKPLFFRQDQSGGISIGSDPAVLEGVREIDADGLNSYLALGYILPELNFYKEVQQVKPGHMLHIDLRSGRADVPQSVAYWSLPSGWDGQGRNLDELAEELEPLICESVRKRLISDVPVAIFLSGGLDSSLVTAAAARSSSNVRTINVSFPGNGKFDETKFAHQISDYFGTDHHVIDGRELLDFSTNALFSSFSDPLADSSIVPTYFISKLTREFATVALGGDGGDELFGGYGTYAQAQRVAHQLRYLPDPLVKMAGQLASHLQLGTRGRAFLRSLRIGRQGLRIAYSPYFDTSERRQLIDLDTTGPLKFDWENPMLVRKTLYATGKTPIEGMTRMDFSTYLPGDILTKVDRASMACSLEVRAPWLDKQIIEFCFRKIPPHLRATRSGTRLVQKALARRLLPAGFNVDRKQGFSLPTASLSQNLLAELNTAESIAGLRSKGVNCFLDQVSAQSHNLSSRLAALAFLVRHQRLMS